MAMYTRKSDGEIQHQVEAELAWDTRLRGAGIGVEVHEGAVCLTGVVDCWARRVAAQEAAHRVGGVYEVRNDVRVAVAEEARRDDGALADAVRHALAWDALVPDGAIMVSVSDGVVTLEGAVDSCTEAEDAERAIRNLSGIVEVRNQLAVADIARGAAVHDAIEDALIRHAERAAQHVKLELLGGEVMVSGHVGSWAERAAVLGAVRGTRGVARVDDRLSIW